jgi:hypothetical protein
MNSWNRILLEKPVVPQPLKKFLAFYRIRSSLPCAWKFIADPCFEPHKHSHKSPIIFLYGSLLDAVSKLLKATISFVMSVCPYDCPSAWLHYLLRNNPEERSFLLLRGGSLKSRNRSHTGWIFTKFVSWVFFEKSVEKIQVLSKCDKNNWCFTWRPMYVYAVSLNSA